MEPKNPYFSEFAKKPYYATPPWGIRKNIHPCLCPMSPFHGLQMMQSLPSAVSYLSLPSLLLPSLVMSMMDMDISTTIRSFRNMRIKFLLK